MTDLPPCCLEVAEPPCPQHAQHARVVREGPRRRHGAGQRVIGESGKVRSVFPEHVEGAP